MEESVTDLVKEADSKLKEFNKSLKYISSIEKENTEASDPFKAQVNKTVDKLIKQLETRRKELLKEIDDTFTKNLKKLWEDKELHETAITNMQGALSFARRSLACQEDTEMLALCAQVSSRLKELNLLTLDCTDTEEIEATKVEFITEGAVQRQSPARIGYGLACGSYLPGQLNAPLPGENYKLVGKLQSTTTVPVIEITTDKQEYHLAMHGKQCDIQVRAEVKINGNIARKNTKLSISASEIIKVQSRKYRIQETINPITTITENTEPNSWTVSDEPTQSKRIKITVKGTYGNRALENTAEPKIVYWP